MGNKLLCRSAVFFQSSAWPIQVMEKRDELLVGLSLWQKLKSICCNKYQAYLEDNSCFWNKIN